MGRSLAALGLAAGEEVTEAQLRNLFGERGRHPDADRIEADRLAAGASAKEAYRAGPSGGDPLAAGRGGRGCRPDAAGTSVLPVHGAIPSYQRSGQTRCDREGRSHAGDPLMSIATVARWT
nr:hypothetical protein [Streptomyces sp. MMG1522]